MSTLRAPSPSRPSAALRGLVLAASVLSLCDGVASAQGTTERVSLRGAGVQGSQRSLYPDLSADGRYVAFQSFAPYLVDGDTNASWDVFRRDRTSGAILRVSVGSGGAQGSGSSQNPSISADGNVVAFDSGAGDLVPGDANSQPDVFVHDVGTGLTTRVSVDSAGQEAAGPSARPALSADGRYVAFQSFAAGLVPGGEGGRWSIYVHDRQTGTTSRVSVDSAGVPADDHSTYPTISADGRMIAFTSEAANLVAGDTNGFDDVFVHDTLTGVTRRVSVDSAGAQGDFYSAGAAISADGSCVAFVSFSSDLVPGDTNGQGDVFVHDLGSGQTSRVSLATGGAQANAGCFVGNLSADGRYVVFESAAGNLVAGDTNGVADVFVRDRQSGVTTRASVATGGAQAGGASHSPRIAGDGRRIAFHSEATNLGAGDLTILDDVYLHDRIAGTTDLASVSGPGVQANGASHWSTVSTDGRYVAFSSSADNLVAGDTNGAADVFVRDRLLGLTERVSVSSTGAQGNDTSSTPFLSADGRFVAFDSWATNLVAGDTNGVVDVFVHDRVTDQTTRVSVSSSLAQTNGPSLVFDISPDGRYVVFDSLASNLVSDSNGTFDVFVHDRISGQTLCASVAPSGLTGNLESRYGSISADGRQVAFQSRASNLVGGDTNGANDVFVRDWQAWQTTRVSVSALGVQGNGGSGGARISADGRYVSFESVASNLVTGDSNGVGDVFVHDRQFAETRRVSIPTSGGSVQGNAASSYSILSDDGRWIAFLSEATNLIPGDINGQVDVFVHDLTMVQTHLVSVDSSGMQANAPASLPWICGDGRFVSFASLATDLVAGDTNGVQDIFLHDRAPLVPTTFCYGDGSEAACPCANDGDVGHGCRNPFGPGVTLGATGTQAANDIVLHGTGYPPVGAPGAIVLRSKNVEPAPVLFGDGLRCVATAGLVRLAAASASGGTSMHPISHGAGPGTFHYQLWYRNAPASYCTEASFNLSSGLSIVWP